MAFVTTHQCCECALALAAANDQLRARSAEDALVIRAWRVRANTLAARLRAVLAQRIDEMEGRDSPK